MTRNAGDFNRYRDLSVVGPGDIAAGVWRNMESDDLENIVRLKNRQSNQELRSLFLWSKYHRCGNLRGGSMSHNVLCVPTSSHAVGQFLGRVIGLDVERAAELDKETVRKLIRAGIPQPE